MKTTVWICIAFLFSSFLFINAQVPDDTKSKTASRDLSVELFHSKSTVEKFEIPDFSGDWDTNFGRMKIYQDGRKVYGSYAWYNGSFKGEINEKGELIITWEQDGGFLCAKGKAKFDLNASGKKFYGTWGCGSKTSGQGRWEGERY